MIRSMGVLSGAVGGPEQVDSDTNSSRAFNVSNVNSSYLKCSTLTVTDCRNPHFDLVLHRRVGSDCSSAGGRG